MYKRQISSLRGSRLTLLWTPSKNSETSNSYMHSCIHTHTHTHFKKQSIISLCRVNLMVRMRPPGISGAPECPGGTWKRLQGVGYSSGVEYYSAEAGYGAGDPQTPGGTVPNGTVLAAPGTCGAPPKMVFPIRGRILPSHSWCPKSRRHGSPCT